jgi:16S rRNA (cytidine1402-2'-O)-methyltransferase
MPCISDPGAVVVSLARQAGIRITAIPGASAAVTAIALSGMEADGFVFLGFLYGTDSQKKNRLAQYAKERLPLVIYSAPHDIKEELKLASEILGKRKICIIKEMTKIYESVDCGILGELQAQNEKGEFVLIIEGFSEEQVCTDEDIIKELTELLQMGVSKKDASAIAARHLNVAKKRAYDLCKNL